MSDLKPYQSTMKFDFDEKQVKQLSNQIKVNFIPGTKFIDGNTYNQIIDKTYDVVKDKFG